jgi:hypothetical protein
VSLDHLLGKSHGRTAPGIGGATLPVEVQFLNRDTAELDGRQRVDRFAVAATVDLSDSMSDTVPGRGVESAAKGALKIILTVQYGLAGGQGAMHVRNETQLLLGGL